MNVVLGVSGSVAAYRAADLARELMRRGCTVRVCLTDSAQKFVTPALFEALTGQPCLQDVFEEPERGRMAHIDWARQASAIVVAPATANVLTKLAHGIADDMLTTIVTASTAPLILAPAMNPQMYATETTRRAIEILRARAAAIVEPTEGEVACGEQGQGKFAPITEIADVVQGVLNSGQLLAGKRVLITSGPTQEPIDSVRFLTNRSSGKMGAALAQAALLMGANVTIVAGPSSAAYPLAARVISIRTAAEMLEASLAESAEADLVIAAAAVADYRPASPTAGKLRRSQEPISLTLEPNPDIVAALAKANPKARVVAFAAEPSTDLEVAKEKRDRKGVFAIAVNDISRHDIGFDADSNELTVLFADGSEAKSGKQSKLNCAIWLLQQLAD